MKIITRKNYFAVIVTLIVLIISFFSNLPDKKLHLVFCDVGQGDSAYIKTSSGHDVLIDGGPNDKVLECLGRFMPFYDRKINIVMVTHPQKDHMQGILSVLERYTVDYVILGEEGNESEGYKQLLEIIKRKQIPVKNLFKGDSFVLGNTHFDILWPDRKWVSQNIKDNSISRVTYGTAVLGAQTDTDLNRFSYFVHLRYGAFDALFTGDGDSPIQPEIEKGNSIPDVEVLKYPHHGSKTGLLPELLDKLKPELAVISVGKNSYGHPTKEALQMLSERSIVTKRTDLDGNIEIVSDGQYWVQKN